MDDASTEPSAFFPVGSLGAEYSSSLTFVCAASA
eukprot:CAMPEP_0177633454 /NCGR_PEP_ID=MMETSP0447-20121125/2846_1 /TAXON_ID=0 /ORGANISM="Stygamoeba regulata, Strain BSH-02190019" /LENGTH=33 /DNA_ID= /DNA_START= /DNA_END= /DNA_ORIENTATION=